MNYKKIIISWILSSLAVITVAILLFIFYQTFHIHIAIVFTFLFLLLIDALFSVYIFFSRRPIYVKLCWTLIICVFHILGVFVFIVFGSQPFVKQNYWDFKKNLSGWFNYDNRQFSKRLDKVNNEDIRQIYKYNFSVLGSLISMRNNINIIDNSSKLFESSINIIRSAKKFIFIETYILNDGYWWRAIVAELLKKIKENVQIKIMYDWVGSYGKAPKRILSKLKKLGVEVAIFNPRGINMFKSITNYRLHIKSIIVDNEVVLYGGSNISDEYLNISPNYNNFFDMNYLISGEIVNEFYSLFLYHWFNFSDHSSNRQRMRNNEFKNKLKKEMQNYSFLKKNLVTQLIHSSPVFQEKTIEQTLLLLFAKAKSSIRIICPYFILTEKILNALLSASMCGVKVEIILPAVGDNYNLIVNINRKFYYELLKYGCHIYEFNGFIHSKYIIVDDSIILSGSNNLDFRSLWINFESALLIYDIDLARILISNFDFVKLLSSSINLDGLIKTYKAWSKMHNAFLEIISPLI